MYVLTHPGRMHFHFVVIYLVQSGQWGRTVLLKHGRDGWRCVGHAYAIGYTASGDRYRSKQLKWNDKLLILEHVYFYATLVASLQYFTKCTFYHRTLSLLATNLLIYSCWHCTCTMCEIELYHFSPDTSSVKWPFATAHVFVFYTCSDHGPIFTLL